MQDASAYCTELVRAADRDRYLATLFAPAAHRDALCALYAFNVEMARVRDLAREPMPGEIRLKWWSEVLGGERGEEAAANPVAAALLDVIGRYGLAADDLIAIVEARRVDLYDEPMVGVADLETYAMRTASVVMAQAARILGVHGTAVVEPAGIASGIAGVLRALPYHAARCQLYLPSDILARHRVEPSEIFARQSSANLNAALAELRSLARHHLAVVNEGLMALPGAALPAFLTVALVRPWLDRSERSDPFAPAELSPWRRQWLIWRAARNPTRIAG